MLSDNENTFAGFYNIGICLRKNKKYEEAINDFKKALDWSKLIDVKFYIFL